MDATDSSSTPAQSLPDAVERAGELVSQVARVQPLWALLRVSDRARYMLAMAQAVIDELDQLCEQIACEQRRPRTEVAILELLAAVDALKWIGRAGGAVLGDRRVGVHRLLLPATRARLAYEPYGVVGVIGAGSAPFAQPLGQIAGALLAGNGVVYKPASRAQGAAERIARLATRAGLPEGLVRILDGGAEAGLALAQAPIDKLMFTGSPATGRRIAQACVAREVEVTVELGGKDAMIVLADANVRRAGAAALWAGCAGAGQARGSVERIYAAPEAHDRLLAGLVERAQALRVGEPRVDRLAQMGPLSSRRRLEHVEELVGEAVADGATLHCGGALGQQEYAPAVLSGVTHEMRIMREQIGGPVLCVMRFDSVSGAIALANDSPFGLGASVWSVDRYRALRIARLLDAGMVWVNDHLPGPMISRGPWGATAGGGLGKALGQAGLKACAQEKLIAWEPSRVGGLWWGPHDELAGRAARTAAKLRSARETDRSRAWREGAVSLVRVGGRALRRGS
ncbi:MAG TPA: aldehyde dehydrogenase family protein [Solirubrobacteraceae bacterium]|nr:aldehyde dehydrogenase family protein [Solirubrobacteraceae bacterium]